MFANPTILAYELDARRQEAPRRHPAGIYALANRGLFRPPRIIGLREFTPATAIRPRRLAGPC
jgi:hypothetical protein